MNESERTFRWPRARLWALLIIAVTTYEVAIYQHWSDRVPLLPAFHLDLDADHAPLGFSEAGEFLVARREKPQPRPQIQVALNNFRGPIEFREFPSGRILAERFSPDDVVDIARPAIAPEDVEYVQNEFAWSSFYGLRLHGAGQPTHDSPARRVGHVFLDHRRALYLYGETLHCHDLVTDRLTWTKFGVQSMPIVDGEFALIMRTPTESSGVPQRPTPELFRLHDQTILEGATPPGAFELVDISPDGRWVAYLTFESMEVWSTESRSRVWKRSFSELGLRSGHFSDDGQTLVSHGLTDSAELASTRIKTADGRRISSEDGFSADGEPPAPAMALLGDSYALFSNPNTPERRQSALIRWANRLGLQQIMPRAMTFPDVPRPRTALLFDVERRQYAGLVELADASFFAMPDGSGFALTRSNRRGPGQAVEFYPFPPNSDWMWLATRAAAPLLLCLPYFAWRQQPRRLARPMAGSDARAIVSMPAEGCGP